MVDWVYCNLRDAGSTGVRITLKSDGEEGMKALKGRVAMKRKCDSRSYSLLSGSRSRLAMGASVIS